MDIGSGAGFPATTLSNFAPHPFVFMHINDIKEYLRKAWEI